MSSRQTKNYKKYISNLSQDELLNLIKVYKDNLLENTGNVVFDKGWGIVQTEMNKRGI